MKKKKLVIAVISGFMMLVGFGIKEASELLAVQAATVKGYIKVKHHQRVRLYHLSGKHSNYYALAKYRYPYSKKGKIGRKKLVAYKIGNNSHWILAKDVKLSKPAAKYQQAKLKLPKGYTKKALLQAYQGKPSKAFVTASMQGMQDNNFSRGKKSENKRDEQEQVDLTNVSQTQLTELTSFSLRLINNARKDLALKPWVNSSGTQKLAQDIAKEYSDHRQTIANGHYVAGIVSASQANGLNLNDNYVEDMAGFYHQSSIMTMAQLKQNIYFGLKQMIFGYVGSGEADRNNRSLYQEWQHAGDLFNIQGSIHDRDYNYFGFSISQTENICSLHYISVPTYIVKSEKYNQGFKP
ncbi:SEC10/PgrA surface exclusion domain-containing protein [Lactobacillus sp. ESL0681]|uniref:SEC10/PgrA surface exclusion domain-containing protein n=1 Tax=Lactobacillus sp. ESL0681 TaxID=2983211 RepID=UPI0023F90217|nr:SEC10/PgrA surface exclusion domain-containing protein [Lactobacillus sp. ESL0681]WEV40158.1 SEC10/PgrA surface exclusion domain-containing protein [Lactobacillus sp. ESL0681]